MKRILVPTDFSKTAKMAAEVAAEIARKSGAELIFLHVAEAASSTSFSVTGEMSLGGTEDALFTMRLIERSKKQLEKILEDDKFQGIDVSTELRVGTPFHGIKTIVADSKVDLVVMGTGGHSQAEQILLGTNTEKVVRRSNCPVLTVHKKPATVDFKNIVYATSMSKEEEVFSRVVRRTQQLFDSTVHLVRINTPGNFQRDAVVMKYMQDFAKKLQLKNYTLNVYNDLTEEEGIIYFADSINADLIAMATHGRTGFAHVLAGSIAEDVVSHAKRPVLTFVTKHRK
jgi:nucleotide-binding universal stress UspA family protein